MRFISPGNISCGCINRLTQESLNAWCLIHSESWFLYNKTFHTTDSNTNNDCATILPVTSVRIQNQSATCKSICSDDNWWKTEEFFVGVLGQNFVIKYNLARHFLKQFSTGRNKKIFDWSHLIWENSFFCMFTEIVPKVTSKSHTCFSKT